MRTCKLLLTTCCIAAVFDVGAADFCATTSAGLQAALSAAASNGQDDHIKLAIGSFVAPVNLGFTYDVGANGDQTQDLTISGGWTPFFDNACGNQFQSTTAFQTVIDGDDRHRGLRIRPGADGNISVRLLTFVGGDPSTGATSGGGLEIETGPAYSGEVRIERSAFLANSASRGSALHVIGGDVIRVSNNLIASNHANGQVAVNLLQHDGTGIYVTNNTIIGNSIGFPGGSFTDIGGLYVYANGSSRAFVANNIVWDNHHVDLQLDGNGIKTLRNNTIAERGGATPDTDIANVAITTVFSGGLFDLTLAEGSPLIDAGVDPPTIVIFPTPFELRWGLPAIDLKGAPRIQGGQVDIGAYEALDTGVFSDGFE